MNKEKKTKKKIVKEKIVKVKKPGFSIDTSNIKHTLMIAGGIFGVMLLIGAVSGDVGVMGILIVIGMFVLSTPVVLSLYKKYRDVKEMEERFPSFLRDLTESIRSGMPFHEAIVEASHNDYGNLSREVNKMAHQLSWGIPLDKVLEKFSNRVKESRRLYTATRIIRESFLSGGEVISTLEAVADSTTDLEEAEKEKRSMLNQYVMLMYAVSIIFVIIVSSINKFLVPVFQTVGESTTGLSSGDLVSLENPCNNSSGLENSICGLYEAIGTVIAPGADPTSITVYYTSLFFMMAVIQSILSGMVAGQIGEGSIRAGIKHSMILSGISVGSFLILVRLGFLGL